MKSVEAYEKDKLVFFVPFVSKYRFDGKKYNTGRVIGVNRAEYITVTQTRSWYPNPIGGIVWLAFGAQDTACYMPLYQGITAIPKSFQIGDHWEFNRDSARWAFDYVDFHTQVLYSLAIQDVRKAQEKWEKSAIKKLAMIDKEALAIYKKDPLKAKEFLTDFCLGQANLVINAWWKLGNDLLVKYNHLWHYDVKSRKRKATKYPEWWLRELVKYNKLKPQPKAKK